LPPLPFSWRRLASDVCARALRTTDNVKWRHAAEALVTGFAANCLRLIGLANSFEPTMPAASSISVLLRHWEPSLRSASALVINGKNVLACSNGDGSSILQKTDF
jgi:hypothetical protein